MKERCDQCGLSLLCNVHNKTSAAPVMKCTTDIPKDKLMLGRYQKTESVIKATTEKTSSLLGGIGTGITSEMGQLKNSESFRSFEERVGSAYENVKTKVSTSRSSSMQSFDDALRVLEGESLLLSPLPLSPRSLHTSSKLTPASPNAANPTQALLCLRVRVCCPSS